MAWIETGLENVNEFPNNFWEKMSSELKNDEFWADRIKELKEQPQKRLKLALEYLPLPGAFKEAALAARALVKEKRKAKEIYTEELSVLYWVAAVNSFSIPYSEIINQPGYNVMESIPGSIVNTLSYSYSELGFNKLELLNKTDSKWCVEIWGEPQFHTTLHELHKEVWNKYECELLSKQKNVV